jgi:hypothetical protein
MKKWCASLATVVVMASIGLGSSVSASVAAKAPKLTKAEQKLVKKHVAPSIADSCFGNTANEKKNLALLSDTKGIAKRLVASVECDAPLDGVVDFVTYAQFKDAAAVNIRYKEEIDLALLEANTPEGAPGTCPVEGQYGPEGNPSGRIGCALSTGSSSVIVWSNDATKILAKASLEQDPDGSLVRAFFASDDAGPF